jgi:hypothetical protein
MEHNSLSSTNAATQSLINSLNNEANLTSGNNNANTNNALLNHLNQSNLQQNILIGNNQLNVKDKTFQIIG